MEIQVKLKDVRKKRGLSQTKLAQKLDMTPQNFQRIELGRSKSIPYDTLAKLCKILDCKVEDILVYLPD